MVSTVTMNQYGALSRAGSSITSTNTALDGASRIASTGKKVSPETAPAEIATLAVMREDEDARAVRIATMGRTKDIADTIITGLQAIKTEMERAKDLAEQVASGLKSADEIAILAAEFQKRLSSMDATALSTTFLGTQVLATDNGTASNVANALGTVTGNTATTSILGPITVSGNVFGTVTDAKVQAVGLGFKVTVTVTDNKGNDYLFENDGVRVANDGVFSLINQTDHMSSLGFTFNGAAADAANIGGEAQNFQNELKSLFRLDNGGALNASFTPNVGLANSGANGAYTIDATAVSRGSGTYRLTQDLTYTGSGTRIIAMGPDGSSEAVVLDAVSQTKYALGISITTASTVALFNADAVVPASIGANAASARYVSFDIAAAPTVGYSKSVDMGGGATLSINMPSQRTSAIGVSTLTIADVASASTAKTTLDAQLTELAKKIGDMGAVAAQAATASENFTAQNETLAAVISGVEDADEVSAITDVIEKKVTMAGQVDAFASLSAHYVQSMAKLTGSL